MRICMEKSVHEYLFQIGFENILCQNLAIQLDLLQGTNSSYLLPSDKVHSQYFRAAVIRNRSRHHNVLEFLQVFSQSVEVMCLLAIVQFVHDRFAEFFQHDTILVALASFGMCVVKLGDFFEYLQVLNNVFPDAWTLNFDCHFATTSHHSIVNLPKRGSRQRYRFEFQKSFGYTNTKFILN